MMVVRFKSKEHHSDMVKKLKKMQRFTDELIDCLEDGYDDDDELEYRGIRYRDHDYEDEMIHEGRYGYRRGGSRRM